jgi:tetratricopeptide (TPR) repeat protein
MMEDERVAKAFISAIIEEEVVELAFAAQERTVRIPKAQIVQDAQKEDFFLTVCRFDFSAKISLPNGKLKTVLIELQKAKLPSDIMRFRRYLGLHYQNPSNAYEVDDKKKSRQIYCIFLLGYDIGMPGHPVIQVDNTVKDRTTKEALPGANEFIEGLHHRSWIVQIDQLKQRRRDNLETLLSVFDQENRTANHHIMNINEEDFPEMYRPIIRRLRMASESEDIRVEMEMEDDYLKDLQDRERLIAKQQKIIEDKDKALEDKDKALEDKDKALEDKDKALEDKNKALEDKDKAIEDKDKIIEELMLRLAENKKQND